MRKIRVTGETSPRPLGARFGVPRLFPTTAVNSCLPTPTALCGFITGATRQLKNNTDISTGIAVAKTTNEQDSNTYHWPETQARRDFRCFAWSCTISGLNKYGRNGNKWCSKAMGPTCSSVSYSACRSLAFNGLLLILSCSL